ncbi:MAG TPA: tRNA dimethylallyltransferase, partial [Patescibacteria group bacterium]|nr:tRNA dimethylallyltransferase [Patescibacteria group bacterium]
NALQIGIFIDRAELYVRINKRVETMIASGLVSEVSGLREKYGCRIKSMTGIGYRQICQYLEGEVNLKEAIEMIKRDTRRYSKRQMTWFKRDRRIIWVSNLNEAVVAIEKFLNKKTP